MRQQRRLLADDTLTKQEAAMLAKVTPRTISRWLADPEVPLNRYTMQINRVAVSKQELERLIGGRAS